MEKMQRGGRGITEKIYRNFLECGAQAVTLGNHAWDNREVFEFIDDAKYLARPANFPEGTPGKGLIFVNCNGTEVAVINLQGRTFLPPIDCPFRKVDELINIAKNVRILYLLISMRRLQVKTSARLVCRWTCYSSSRYAYACPYSG